MADDRSAGSRDESSEGMVEGIKGKAKEALGKLTGDETTHREGQAQQAKAEAEQKAAEEQAEADRARAQARTHEERQRSYE